MQTRNLQLKKVLSTALFVLLLSVADMKNAAVAQTTFTQTSTNDFVQGTGLYTSIVNDAVSLQYQMSSFDDWNATTNLPQTLKGHQMVTWRNFVYLLGGTTNGTNTVNTVYRATQETNGISAWTTLTAMPVALKDMAVVATQTQLIVFGGRNGNGASDKIYAASLNDDGSIGSWKELSFTLAQPCWGMNAVTALDNLYIIGGATTDGTDTPIDKVYCLKLNADGEISSMMEVNSLPEVRNGQASVVYDSKIIVTGGCGTNNAATNTVYSASVNLDGSLSQWQVETSLPVSVFNHTAVCTNGIIAVMGGQDDSMPSNRIYCTALDGTAFSWDLSDIMLPERFTEGAAFALDNKVFFGGGQTLAGSLDNGLRFMNINTSDTPVQKAAFIGLPYDIGIPKNLQQLDYTLDYTSSTTTYEILYRLAGYDKVFGDWISAGSNLPVVINQSMSHVQYMFRFTANGTDNLFLDDVSLTVTGFSQLAGSLNDMDTISLSGSPYLVTSDISFTSGTHQIEAGVVFQFMPNTAMNIGRASVNFNGTEANPILLTSNGGEGNNWNGVYFQDASDYGVSSVMNYTTIEKAGFGDNNANLRLYYTNQPTISHCTFSQADGHSLRLDYSNPVIASCNFDNNSESGLFLNNSSPTCTDCVMNGNEYSGIYYATANSNANLVGVTVSNNLYGLFSNTPDRSFTFDESIIEFNDNGSDIAIAAGRIASNQTWNSYSNGYAILGNVEIYGVAPKLTIAPNSTIKVQSGSSIYVGGNNVTGGMLYAVGTASAPITFTSLNGEAGGWNGLNFRDGSDYNSASSLRYCIVEKATINLYCVNTNQPGILRCSFQNASSKAVELSSANITVEETVLKDSPYGLSLSSSQPTLISDTIRNTTEGCVYYANAAAAPNLYTCFLKDSFIGIRYYTPDLDLSDVANVTFDNVDYRFGVNGGDIVNNRQWNSAIAVFGTIRVGCYQSPGYCRLTLSPGSTLGFAPGTGMQISWYSYGEYRGELNAIGAAETPITFTALNGESGGWNGLCFNDLSDNISGMESILEHCIIEKGNTYNLYMGNTNQPSNVSHSTFKNALGRGVYIEGYGSTNMTNCQILNNGGEGVYCVNSGNMIMTDCEVYNNGGDGIKSETAMMNMHNVSLTNNGGYGMYYTNAHYMNVMEDVEIEGNALGQVAMAGGDITESRTWNTYSYDIFGTIRVGCYQSPGYCRLTLSPGSTLGFAPGTGMQISWYSYGEYRGELNAIGTAETPITFTALNGESGGWNGLYFNDYSDNISGMSSIMEHCIIEKGNTYNLMMENTNQPSQIRHCTFRDAVGYGVQLNNASPALSNSIIMNNASYGLYLTGNSTPVVGASAENSCDIYLNGGFNIYQDGTANVNMQYNFMGNPDSLYVDQHSVYDQIDNSAKGKVSYMPLSFLPSNTAVSGTLLYDANPNKPITGQTLVVEDIDHNLLYEAEVDMDGRYTIPEAIGMFNRITLQPGFDVLEGVNATDALLTMRHFVHLDELEGQHASVADVNANGIINGTDALLILRRTLGNSFPAGDYAFTADTLTFDGEVLNYPLSVMLFGDVNASYTPHNRDFTMELVQDGLVLVGPNQEVELPVRIKTAAEMGALTLYFGYPEEYLEIENVTLTATGESLLFAASDGVLKTGWYNLSPVAMNEDDLLLNITVHTKDFAMLDEPIGLSLSAFSELADGAAQVVSDVVIAMPMMTTLTLNTQDNGWEETLAVAVYPNPAKGQCTLTYQMEHEGRVTVSVYDVTGVKRMSLSDACVEAGSHQLQLSTSGLAAGVYYCRITLEGEANVERVIKLIVEK